MSSKGETETSQELYEDHEIYEDLQNVISSLKEQLLIQERRLAAHSQQLDFKSDEIRVLRRQLAAQSLVREQKRKMVNSIGGPLNQNQVHREEHMMIKIIPNDFHHLAYYFNAILLNVMTVRFTLYFTVDSLTIDRHRHH
jgi:hypothetical protein